MFVNFICMPLHTLLRDVYYDRVSRETRKDREFLESFSRKIESRNLFGPHRDWLVNRPGVISSTGLGILSLRLLWRLPIFFQWWKIQRSVWTFNNLFQTYRVRKFCRLLSKTFLFIPFDKFPGVGLCKSCNKAQCQAFCFTEHSTVYTIKHICFIVLVHAHACRNFFNKRFLVSGTYLCIWPAICNNIFVIYILQYIRRIAINLLFICTVCTFFFAQVRFIVKLEVLLIHPHFREVSQTFGSASTFPLEFW